MKNLIKYPLFFLTLVIILNGCAALKDGLEGSKKSKSAEEFLINKKNPLILPPDFDILPEPKNNGIKKEEEEKFNIENIIGKNKNKKKISINENNSSLEKSIIEKIKKD
tara:strand:+ start:1114 stop:1440 length:327 start_codon:yes stop_codon:yes gene_type:complete